MEPRLKPFPDIASILVVCDGNHCRSPIGEALLREALGSGVAVGSAGLTALVGFPPHPQAIALMAESGMDISGHRGRQLTPELALAADLILVMDARQKEDCHRMVPSVRGRVYLLGQWQPAGSQEILDPFRKGPEVFRHSFEHIRRSIADWPSRLSFRQRRA